MTTTVSNARFVRNSPFSESEWDRRLDHLLQDLENAASVAQDHAAVAVQQKQHQTARSASSERSRHVEVTNNGGYASVLTKSKSTSSLGPSADNMLKDLDAALKASTNYIESHRTVQLPNGHQEFHEYRSSSSSGAPRTASNDFNLERQVQHMMPAASSSLAPSSYSGLQSANMVSSMQSSTTMKQSYTSYKVQSNSYTSGGERLEHNTDSGDRPGSRLKANIDELDTLLSDLNNAQRGGSTHSSRHDNFVSSSEDYGDQSTIMQGNVKKTISSMNEYTMSGSSEYNRKPPSPSPKRRTPQPVLSSPAPGRRTSPSPSGRRASPPTNTLSSTNYSSSYNYNSSRGSSPPRKRSPSPRLDSQTPTGHAYYSKYHSNYSSSNNHNNGPASFPTCPSPSPNRGPSLQTPPKRVDDLMTELSEFDPSIQHTTFVEPTTRPAANKYNNNTSSMHHDEEDFGPRRRHQPKEPSPIRPLKQSSTPGPAVYYPPGELFSSTRNDSLTGPETYNPPSHASRATTLESSGARGRAKARAEYGYKEKGKYSEAESKQGAAVVPICLPLCCAAPCVIL